MSKVRKWRRLRGIQKRESRTKKPWKHVPFSTCILGGGMQDIIKKHVEQMMISISLSPEMWLMYSKIHPKKTGYEPGTICIWRRFLLHYGCLFSPQVTSWKRSIHHHYITIILFQLYLLVDKGWLNGVDLISISKGSDITSNKQPGCFSLVCNQWIRENSNETTPPWGSKRLYLHHVFLHGFICVLIAWLKSHAQTMLAMTMMSLESNPQMVHVYM